ncbi:uncharacterized protein [Petaurus breviceps papuanus]|uniref:uncharacterized protein n=1 Tax=Petaurus breviceps papuanus TaxID=3040969 RepID=UPI0036D987EC
MTPHKGASPPGEVSKTPPLGREANFPTKVTGIRVRRRPESPATLRLRSGAADHWQLGGRAPPALSGARDPETGHRPEEPPRLSRERGEDPGGGRRPVIRRSAMAPARPQPHPSLPRRSLAAPLHVTEHPFPGPARPGPARPASVPLSAAAEPPPLPRPAPPDPAPPPPPPRPRAHLRLRRPPRPRPRPRPPPPPLPPPLPPRPRPRTPAPGSLCRTSSASSAAAAAILACAAKRVLWDGRDPAWGAAVGAPASGTAPPESFRPPQARRRLSPRARNPLEGQRIGPNPPTETHSLVPCASNRGDVASAQRPRVTRRPVRAARLLCWGGGTSLRERSGLRLWPRGRQRAGAPLSRLSPADQPLSRALAPALPPRAGGAAGPGSPNPTPECPQGPPDHRVGADPMRSPFV